MSEPLLHELEAAARLYLDALYEGDVDRFRVVFHPAARLYSATEGKLVTLDLEDYCTLVAGRPSPAARGDERDDEILSLVVSSPTTAHARVRDQYLPKRFVDELTFVHVEGRWRIVAKVWHFELG